MKEASKSNRLSQVIVATDDHRIAEAVRRFGGSIIMTSGGHQTGSDRVAAVAAGLGYDYVINIQGDEPFLPAEVIDRVIGALDEPGVVMSTACSPFNDPGEPDNPNAVKVVLDRNGDALYFSRSPIPFVRPDSGQPKAYFRHIGIYGFKREFLLRFASLERTPLEMRESLEQLRALEHGYKIRVITADFDFVGIDSEADLIKAEEILSRQG